MDHPRRSSAKVLIAAGDADCRAALTQALTDAGYEVAVAPSGSFALTMLEWEPPDVIVSAASVDDMDGAELFTLVRKDPATIATPFLLIGASEVPRALDPDARADITTITAEFTVELVVERVRTLLARDAERAGQAAPVEPAGARRSLQALWQAIEAIGPTAEASPGSLAADATEVVQAIALGGKTGCLVVSLTAGRGIVLFENGRVAHASFDGLSGEPAFTAVIAAARGEAQPRFCFSRADGAEVAHLPKTISRTVDQLLGAAASAKSREG